MKVKSIRNECMRQKFKIGDIVIRKPLPQYEGYGQPILTIEKVDAERGYYFCGYDKDGYGFIFDIERQDDFVLYKPSFIRRIKCWFNTIKSQKSKAMKKLFFLALLAMMMVGCEKKDYKGGSVDGFDIVIVDSCEYIISTYAHGGIMAHKGNCRFCRERDEQLIRRIVREEVDSILTKIFD